MNCFILAQGFFFVEDAYRVRSAITVSLVADLVMFQCHVCILANVAAGWRGVYIVSL